MTAVHLELDIKAILARYLDREVLDRYYVELMKENELVNLVSRETSRSDFDRLCAESLLPLDVTPKQVTNYLDIGAGGGIPAIPLILSGRISGQSVLVERTLKKAAALGRITAALKIPCQVVARTFEEVSRRERFDLITLRYVKLNRTLLRKIGPLLTGAGGFVYYSDYALDSEDLEADRFTFSDSDGGNLRHFTVFGTK